MKTLAGQDGQDVGIWFEQDPGQAGVVEVQYLVKEFAGYETHVNKVSTNKVTRAKPASAQAEQRNIKLLRGAWNNDFLKELDMFPDGAHDDQVDAFSGAVNRLLTRVEPRIMML